MTEEHPNISLMKKLDLRNLAEATDLFAPEFVWHYINPNLPDLEGDYAGPGGLQTFVETIGKATGGSFSVRPISATDYGDELVVTHARNSLVFQEQSIAVDAVVVWRIVNGKIVEAWDIPSTHKIS